MESQIILSPRDSAQFIHERSKDVKIVEQNVKKLGQVVLKGLQCKDFDLADWKKMDVNPKVADDFAVDWIFFVDTLNFSFWTESDKRFFVTYNNKKYAGYFSLCAAVQKAIKAGIDLTNPSFYSTISYEQLRTILKSDTGAEMSLLEERHRVLLEAGDILLKRFGGSFVNCVRQCKGSAQCLIQLVIENFPSYRDTAVYEGKCVAFYKRAQIVVADLWACFEGQGLGDFSDIETITMFADYRVPQVLAHFGILKYSNDLMKKLKQKEQLLSGSREEVEIRGCSIWAVELIKEELNKIVTESPQFKPEIPINSILIDFFLWEYRRKNASVVNAVPFHRVRSIYY